MTKIVQSTEVFTPNQLPSVTYVEREQDFERDIRNGLRTPNIIISVSGPSKSGKSVLLQKVVGSDNLIRIFGAQIRTIGDLWNEVLDWMGAPSTRSQQSQNTTTSMTTGGGSVTVGAPGILTIGGASNLSRSDADANTQSLTYARSGLSQVAKEISGSDFVVFIDDFHYIDRNVQAEVAKQIKAAAELGIRICVASVPHRSDDAVRANPELRGRVMSIDMDYWKGEELVQIARRGFPHLNILVDENFIHRLAKEACGSPQLMQSLCLQTCFRLDVFEGLSIKENRIIPNKDIEKILETASALTDFSTLVEKMHEGPKRRGNERKEYAFVDGTRGDVYRSVLLALAADPPTMSLSYSQLIARVGRICTSEAPAGSSVSEACGQIDKIAAAQFTTESMIQGPKPVEWDTTSPVETIHIAEPYFLFFLRASKILSRLGKTANPVVS